jgi:hypothetical protein
VISKYRILLSKSKRNIPLARSTPRWDDKNKADFKVIEIELLVRYLWFLKVSIVGLQKATMMIESDERREI